MFTIPCSKSIDLRPVARDHRDLIGAVSIPSTKTALEAAPNQFSALFDNLSHWFLKTLPASPLNPKIWRQPPPKSLIPKDRGGGGVASVSPARRDLSSLLHLRNKKKDGGVAPPHTSLA